jgi:hypothetical protein
MANNGILMGQYCRFVMPVFIGMEFLQVNISFSPDLPRLRDMANGTHCHVTCVLVYLQGKGKLDLEETIQEYFEEHSKL